MSHPAITISRTLGSGGAAVGLMVARQLGWRFCDRHILRRAAEALGMPGDALRVPEEHPTGFLDQLMALTAFASPEVPYTPPLEVPVYSRELFEVERGILLRLVEEGPAVLVGRGGFLALRGRPRVLHVRIVADAAVRMRSLVARGKAVDMEAARRAIEASDRDRASLVREIAGLDWADPAHFDLVLDTSLEGPEICAERIVAEARERFA